MSEEILLQLFLRQRFQNASFHLLRARRPAQPLFDEENKAGLKASVPLARLALVQVFFDTGSNLGGQLAFQKIHQQLE